MPDDAEAPALRRDAERNRGRILEAAGRLIGERGLDISHDEIARKAHVGVGTVYRRFPTREQLFDALGGPNGGRSSQWTTRAPGTPEHLTERSSYGRWHRPAEHHSRRRARSNPRLGPSR